MSRVSSLFRLQSIDLELDRLRARQVQIRAGLEDEDAVLRLRSGLGVAEKRLQAARTANKMAEFDVEAQKEKIETTERKLYGGTVHNPKELQDLQKDLEALKRYWSVLEDRLLETMLELEEAQAARDKSKEELAHTEAVQAMRRTELSQGLDQLLSDTDRLQAEREAALASVTRDDLTTYNLLRQSRGGIAVALARDNSCSSCGLVLPASLDQLIRSGADLIRCNQCGRILYAG